MQIKFEFETTEMIVGSVGGNCECCDGGNGMVATFAPKYPALNR